MTRIHTPQGEITPTPEQDAEIERRIDMGQVNPIQAARRLFPQATGSHLEEEPELITETTEEPNLPEEPNHEKRVAELQIVKDSALDRGPLRSKLIQATGEDVGRLRLALKDNQNTIDRAMTRACSACILKGVCEITKEGYEGLREVHPRIKESRYPERDTSTEPLVDMVERIEPNPNAHCDPEKDTTAVAEVA